MLAASPGRIELFKLNDLTTRRQFPPCDAIPNWFSHKDKTANKKSTARVLFLLAASPGLEPRLTESESAVLPLDDEATKDFVRQGYILFFI